MKTNAEEARKVLAFIVPPMNVGEANAYIAGAQVLATLAVADAILVLAGTVNAFAVRFGNR